MNEFKKIVQVLFLAIIFITTAKAQTPPAPTGANCSVGSPILVFQADFEGDISVTTLPGWTGTGFSGTPGNWDLTRAGTNTPGTGPETSIDGNPINIHVEYEGNQQSTAVASAITPAIDLTNNIDDAELTFYMHATGADIGTFNVNVGTSATGPFTNEFTWTGEYQQNTTDPWFLVGVNLGAYVGQVIYIEFSYSGAGTGNKADFSFDQVEVRSCDSVCDDPTGFVITNYNGTEATAMWDNQGTATWNYALQPLGAGIPSTPTGSATTNTVTVTGLDPAVTYEFYIQTDCGSGITSNWVGPFTVSNELVPVLVGDTQQIGDDCYLITDDLIGQIGAVWYNNPIDLTSDFEVFFDANFGSKDADGADGITFVLKTNPSAEVGNSGIGLGYEGIDNSVAIEFDTWDNTDQNNGDLAEDHIGIFYGGSTNHNGSSVLAGPVQASSTSPNIEDDTFHEIKIIWTAATQTLDVYFDCDLRLSYTGDIVTNYLNNSTTAFFGFTGSTGGFSNRQELCFKRISFVNSLTLTDKTICLGDSVNDIDATYSGATSYSWSPATGVSDTTIADPVFTPTTTTTYTVTIADDCGSTFTDSFTINVYDTQLTSLSSNTPICIGDDAIFTLVGTPNATVTYIVDGGTTTQTVTLDTSGSATVTVTNPTADTTIQLSDITFGSCSTVLTNTETVAVTPAVSVTSLSAVNIEITAGSNAEFTIVGTPNAMVTYTVDGGATTQTITLDASGNATATILAVTEDTTIALLSVDLNGCTEVLTDTATVIVNTNEIPSAFSPNNDSVNDTFDIGFLADNIKVYNRYGLKVYEKEFYRNEWNGTSDSGDELPVGTYYYAIETAEETLTGWVYINREK